MNIYMYLYLKSTKANVHNHPVIKRLFQYRQLLLQLEPVFEEIVKPQIELILEEDATADKTAELDDKKRKTLKLLASLSKTTDTSKTKRKKKKHSVSEDEEQSTKQKKKVKFADENIKIAEKKKEDSKESSDESSESEGEQNGEGKDEEKEGKSFGSLVLNSIFNNLSFLALSKRAITYKMAKNKGLTPHRKKEQRNPRVKHRMKYRKAVIRRKGAVREPRKEISRYGGEHSGIKANVSRSVKIKT